MAKASDGGKGGKGQTQEKRKGGLKCEWGIVDRCGGFFSRPCVDIELGGA